MSTTIEDGSVYSVAFNQGQADATGYALRAAMRYLRESGATDDHAVDLLARLDSAERTLDAAPIISAAKDEPRTRLDALLGTKNLLDLPPVNSHARLVADRARLREALVIMLGSAHPHPSAHPAMYEAWQQARAALKSTE